MILDRPTKEEFIQRVFKGCSKREGSCPYFEVLYECDSSINQASGSCTFIRIPCSIN